MSSINRLLWVGLLSVGFTAATTAQAENQLFTAEWYTRSFGNEIRGGTGESEYYEVFGIPAGLYCNANQPRCPFNSTPTDGAGNFAPLGGDQVVGLFCTPWLGFGGKGTTVRPAKYETQRGGGPFYRPIPPLYRNPAFFTTTIGGLPSQPKTTFCSATSYSPNGGPGLVQVGHPVAGTWGASTTAGGAFNFGAAPLNALKAGIGTGQGARGTTTGGRTSVGSARSAIFGDFPALYPYVYSYSYATLRNDVGVFGPGQGPGSFELIYSQGANPVATVRAKERAGGNKFGGTMKMLGAYTTKVCYYRNNGCSLGLANWRYDAIGAAAFTAGGVVTKGYQALHTQYYYHSALMLTSTISVIGSRFPWTTGSVTVKATGRGPHKTFHSEQGYDNRATASPLSKGTIQLVTPVITRWLQPCCNFETGGVGILRIKFIPEPQTWAMLIAGISLLGVGTRMRGR